MPCQRSRSSKDRLVRLKSRLPAQKYWMEEEEGKHLDTMATGPKACLYAVPVSWYMLPISVETPGVSCSVSHASMDRLWRCMTRMLSLSMKRAKRQQHSSISRNNFSLSQTTLRSKSRPARAPGTGMSIRGAAHTGG